MANLVEIIFIFLAVSVGVAGELISRFREYLPTFILQSYLYGSFAYQGEKSAVVKQFELPKSSFKHFYVFASVLVSAALFLICWAYIGGNTPSFIQHALSSILQQKEPSVCFAAAACSIVLLTLQIYRRTYETQRLQVFAAKSKINLSHYVAGFVHYLGCIITIVGQAPLFSGNEKNQFIDAYTATVMIPCIIIFLRAWHEQYKTNVIFSNLRKDKKSGSIVTEQHGLPKGRWFDYVSSPHRFTEVLMYTSLLILHPTWTFFCIYLWVFLNQVQTAVLAHQWYIKTFPNYPKQCCAIFPKVL